MLDVSNVNLAEAIYFFILQEDVYKDFCEKVRESNISMAEYVVLYRQSEFEEWLLKKGWSQLSIT